MNKTLTQILMLALFVSASACSNQWRDADAGVESTEVLKMLGEAGAANVQASSVIKSIDSTSASVYFAEAPGNLGTVASVMSLSYFNFLGKNDAFTFRNVSYVRLFFIDDPRSSHHSNALIIGIKEGTSDTLKYYSFSGVGVFDSGEFEAILKDSSSGRQLVLRSWDVEDDEFKSVIQLRVSDVDSSGFERYIGKFSTLVGYGG